MFVLAGLIFVLVMGLLAYALFHRGPREPEPSPGSGSAVSQRRGSARLPGTGFVVAGGVVLPIVVLLPMLGYVLSTMAALVAPDRTPSLEVAVVGHQFWWTVRYPGLGFQSANEVHIPVGEPVKLTLRSSDVIHSFWVPQLMGKQDLTPGHTTETWIQADQPGVYWGECAEYCGVQHAKMAFVLVAQQREEFEAWVAAEQRPAVEVVDPVAQRGAQVFARSGCIACHAIRYGTGTVGGEIGPDLTHFGSRLTIGAGILPNNLGNLAGWIANPQAIKRGSNMPASYLDADSLLAVVSYLESLK
jgi:cytochrome c oxidase subunit 2